MKMFKRDYLLKLGLSQLQIDLIIGTLLGDANLQTYTNGLTWRYRALHSSDHLEYLHHKFEILSSFINASIETESSTFDKRTNKTYKRHYFNTTVQYCFKVIADAFYKYDKKEDKFIKIIPLNIKEFLTPRAIAYLHQDDGCLKWKGKSNAMRICTENFTVEEVQLIQNSLFELYNIKTGRNKKTLKDGSVRYRIAIPEASSTAYRKLIQPYLVNCMKYKVSNGCYGSLSD